MVYEHKCFWAFLPIGSDIWLLLSTLCDQVSFRYFANWFWHLTTTASKVMLKILQARLQQYVKHEILDVQGGFRKGRGTRDQIANICWIIEKARGFQKNIYFCFIDCAKALTVWITTNCGKFLKRWNTRPPDLPLEKSYASQEATVRTGHGTTDWSK